MPSEAVEDQYESEQAELRRKHGYDDAAGDDTADFVTQLPEVNPEIYKDVEPLLFQGFVTATAVINGETFVFKSLNHHEFGRLTLLGDVRRDPVALQTYYNTFLAYGVLLVGGTNVLHDRHENIPELVEFFGGLHKEAKQSVIRYLSEVNRRATRAVILTEAFSIESRSRLRWAQFKGLDLTSTSISGFEGTTSLGLNWGQLTWRALNHFEDSRDEAEREWENAKFIASSMAGKGMSRIYNRDKQRRRDEQKTRIDRREKLIRHVLLNEPLEGAHTGPIQVARTVEELSSQLDRDLRGEHDWHDKVIAQHEGRIQHGYESRLAEMQEMRIKHIEQFGDKPIVALTDIKRGYTPQEVQRRLEEKKVDHARSQAAAQRFLEFTDEKQAKFANRWMQRSSSQVPPSVIPAQAPTRPQVKPFNGGRR